MKTYIPIVAALVAQASADVKGFDISHYQSSVDFEAAYVTLEGEKSSKRSGVIIKRSRSQLESLSPPRRHR